MTRKPSSKPTEAELAILNVLWQSGPKPVRDVNEQLQADNHATGYTTTLKLLQLMHGKGLVIRDESERAHIYAAAMPKSQVEYQMLGDLVSRLFGGSSQRLVMQALGQTPPVSRVELDEIRVIYSLCRIRFSSLISCRYLVNKNGALHTTTSVVIIHRRHFSGIRNASVYRVPNFFFLRLL